MSSKGFHITEQLTVGRKFSRLSSEKYISFPFILDCTVGPPPEDLIRRCVFCPVSEKGC
jgi:hypothetical protein